MKRRLIASILLAVAALLGSATGARAHALLAETDPVGDSVVDESPASVSATFNESVEIAFGALRVYDTNGERVDEGESTHPDGDSEVVSVELQEDLPDGTYTVTYRVVSADGHPIEGAWVFHVGRPGEKPEGIGETLLSGSGGSGPTEQSLFGIARWALFAGITLLVGCFAFLVFIWRRSATPQADDHVNERFITRWQALSRWAWSFAVIGTALGFVLQGAVAADISFTEAVSMSVASELLETRYGVVAAFRVVLLVAIGGIWIASRRRAPSRAVWPLRTTSTAGAADAGYLSPVLVGVAGVALALLAATPGMSGHAGATDPTWLNVPVDGLHVLAAGTWIGGLAVLMGCAYRAAPSEARQRVRVLGPVVSRFSDVALISVGIIVATGVYRSWIELQAWRAFVDAPYGWVLLTKLGVFIPLLGLGAINNRILKPRVERVTEKDGDDARALASLKRVVSIELALGIVVLAVTALLVNLSPGRVEAGVTGPYVQEVALGEDQLELVVDPNQVGENLIHLTVTTPEGTPGEIQAMKVRFTMPSEDIGPLVADGRQLGPGHFVVQGHQLSIPGDWVLEIEARIDKFTNATTEVEVPVNQ